MVLIVLEGGNASGKKTQAQLLASKIKRTGRKAVLLAFPSYNSPYGRSIEKYLKGGFGPRERVPPKFASLLYALDRYARQKEIEGYLKKGYAVILDRYTQANLAYQTADLRGAAREEMLEWIEKLESRLPKADAVVFLDVAPARSKKLIAKRKNKIRGVRKDIHEKDYAFEKRVYANYKKLARGKRWITVKCTAKGRLKSKEEIARLVFDSLRKRKLI